VLLSAQADAREMHLSSMFGALIEEASLAKRLRATPEYEKDQTLVESLNAHVEFLQREANQVCSWLHEMTGLVEPNPTETLKPLVYTCV
jgi:hypothetical protein